MATTPGAVAPALRPFNGAGIPDALKQFNRWAPWVAQWNAKRGKWDKIPRFATNSDVGLSNAKPHLWSPYDVALAAYRKRAGVLAGVGYCITGPHGVVGIDLDNCLVDGVPAPWAAEVVERLASYTERSPSGNGLRIMGLGAISVDWVNHEVGIEVYGGNQARFLTVTGEHVPGTPTDLRPFDPFVLEDLARDYARERKTADVIDLTIPEVLDELALPDMASLGLPDRVAKFMATGEADGDRSGLVHAAGVALYSLGLDDEVVFSLLAMNAHTMGVALDHRRQDTDRALLYLWREHCLKAKGKAGSAVATLDEFDTVAVPAAERALPNFKRDKNGRIEATIENVAMAVQRSDLCGMEVRFDRFRDEIMFAPAGTAEWRPFTDPDYARLRIALEKGGFKPIGRELIRDVVLLVADEHPFDSAQEWLGGLEHDGTQRVERFLVDYFGCEDTEYTRAVSRYLWTAMAGRVMAPGVKADMVPILVGAQGSGKSTAVAAMAPGAEFFCEVSFHEKDEDLARKMRGRLVAEIGELRGLHTKELESIKAFITRTHENWIPKYREFAVLFPRRLVFVGTTNKDEFLADETGNRRWLPVRVERVDVDGVRRDRDQLWAEAREMFTLIGVDYRAAESLSASAHDEHSITDTWVDAIAEWLERADDLTGELPRDRYFLRVADVLKGALGFDDKHIGRKEELRMGAILRALGYSRKKVRDNARVVWAYVPQVAPPFPNGLGR